MRKSDTDHNILAIYTENWLKQIIQQGGLRTKFGRFCLHNTNSRQDISILIRNYSTVQAISEIITQAGLTMKKLRNTSFFSGKEKGVYFQPQTPKNLGPVPAGCL